MINLKYFLLNIICHYFIIHIYHLNLLCILYSYFIRNPINLNHFSLCITLYHHLISLLFNVNLDMILKFIICLITNYIIFN